jgi:hypothetical protein
MSETVNMIAPSMNGGITETIGESMEIVATKEPWSEYILKDGTKIRAKQSIVNIVKLDQKNSDGTNVYVLRGQPTLYVIPESYKTVADTSSEIEAIFNDLYEKWYEETKYLSSSQMFENEYYKKIISLGIAVVPVIIARLKKNPEHLFVALNKITNINPVKSENRGKIKKMAEDWILWWEENKNVTG